MKKSILALSVAILVAIPLVLGVAFVYAEGAKMKIDKPAELFKGGKKKKTAVEFNHDKHAKDISCKECHHTEDEAKLKAGAKPLSCLGGECHGPNEKVVGGKTMLAADKVYHKNCLDECHKKDEKAKAAKAPTKCKECHPGAED
jgi:hypothetical protein